jgi:hypothetical protein
MPRVLAAAPAPSDEPPSNPTDLTAPESGPVVMLELKPLPLLLATTSGHVEGILPNQIAITLDLYRTNLHYEDTGTPDNDWTTTARKFDRSGRRDRPALLLRGAGGGFRPRLLLAMGWSL